MTEALAVRNATLADDGAIARLSGMLGYPVEVRVVRERLERLLRRADAAVLVAERPGTGVVAWLHAAVLEMLESDRRCEILGLVVDAEHRRTGAGRRLVEAAEHWAREQGLDQAGVRSNVARAESHPFYERLGYTRAKTQHAYRKRLSPLPTSPPANPSTAP